MVRAVVVAILLLVCIFGVDSMAGKRTRRGFNPSGYGSERGAAGGYGSERGGGGRYNRERGSDERDASISREDRGEYSEENYESRESAYGRDDYNSNERRHGSRPR